VFLGAVVLDYEMRGTYWVVAHFHYVMVGGATALFGGLYYWYPKITGKMYDEFLGKVHFAAYFVGFNLLYFPLFVVWETPRRVFNYSEAFTPWHRIATIGGFVLGFSFLIMFYNMGKSLWTGEVAGKNPWAYSTTAEWAINSPPPLENFPGVPSYREGKLTFLDRVAPDGGTTAQTDGGANVVQQAHGNEGGHAGGHDDHASLVPFILSLGGFVLFVGMAGLFNYGVTVNGQEIRGVAEALRVGAPAVDPAYLAVTVGGGVLLTFGLVAFALESFEVTDMAVAERWPFDGVERGKLGMWLFLASDVVLFAGFIGSYIFIRVAEGWNAAIWALPEESLPGLVNTYILLTSSFTVVLALVAAEKGSSKGVVASLAATVLLSVGFLGNKGLEWLHLFHEGHTPSAGIAESTFFLTTGLHAAHVVVGILIALFMIGRAARGAYVEDDAQLEYYGLYWHFVDIVWLFLFPLFYIV
jgi:cytochrome c oxidase subunit I+III